MLVAALLVPVCARVLDDSFVVMAVMANNTELVERLMTAIPDRTELATGAAAASNNLPMLEWLVDHQFPLTPPALWTAMFHADIEIIDWLDARGIRLERRAAWAMARAARRPKLCGWLVDHGYGAEPGHLRNEVIVIRAAMRRVARSMDVVRKIHNDDI